MCNKLNRLNMEEKFISPQKRSRESEMETHRDLKQIRKRTHCAIRRSKFLIQFKYEEKKVIESSSKKCARIKVGINNACLFFFQLTGEATATRTANNINLKNVTNYRTDY